MKKDAKFSDFYKVWTGDDKKEARSSRSSFQALKEKGVQLWRVDKIDGGKLIVYHILHSIIEAIYLSLIASWNCKATIFYYSSK